MPLPEWIDGVAGKMASLLSLDLWRIHLHPDNSIQRPEGNEGCDGLAAMNSNYYTADIYLDRDLAPDQNGIETVIHEVFHLAFLGMRDAAADIIEFTDERHHKTLSAIYDRAEEQLITRIVRGMARDFDFSEWTVKKMPEEEKAAAKEKLNL